MGNPCRMMQAAGSSVNSRLNNVTIIGYPTTVQQVFHSHPFPCPSRTAQILPFPSAFLLFCDMITHRRVAGTVSKVYQINQGNTVLSKAAAEEYTLSAIFYPQKGDYG